MLVNCYSGWGLDGECVRVALVLVHISLESAKLTQHQLSPYSTSSTTLGRARMEVGNSSCDSLKGILSPKNYTITLESSADSGTEKLNVTMYALTKNNFWNMLPR